jgi:hypothetical protein
VDVRIELAVGRDLLEALLAEHVSEGARHQRDALLQLGLLVRLRGLERPLEVVEHRQELLHEPLVGARDQALLVTRSPLAVVVELGLDALERVEQLVTLLLKRFELRGLLNLLGVLDVLRHYEVFASSSSMTS